MTRQTTLKLQHFTAVSAAQVAVLRGDADALVRLLQASEVRRTSLGAYWHAVAYFLSGEAKNPAEPFRWFVDGGEVVGKTAAGDVRYLSPAEVARLAHALEDESPDELGHFLWDEAKMDALGIYPRRWVRDAEDSDQLSTIRELYSYVRDHLATSSQEKAGAIIHLTEETVTDEDAPPSPAPAASKAAPTAAQPTPPGEVVFTGWEGQRYHRADASTHPQATATVLQRVDSGMAHAGLRHIGDFTPSERPGDTVRAFVSDDRTVAAIQYFSAKAVGGRQLWSRLEGDALVTASSALLQQVTKARFFVEFVQNAEPEALLAALLARRAKLEKKHGKPVPFEATLAAVAAVWDEQFARLQGGWPARST